MTVNVYKIYRVLLHDSDGTSKPETCWTKDKDDCIDYVKAKQNRGLLDRAAINDIYSVEEATLCDETPLELLR